jgi:hypothetical protein
MKKVQNLNFNLMNVSLVLTMFITFFSVESALSDTIYIGSGTPVTSNKNGNTQNVTGSVTDSDKNGLADSMLSEGSDAYGDRTNTRDANWHVTYTDVFASEYKKYMAGDATKINERRAAVEESLKGYGSTIHEYAQSWSYGPSVSKFVSSTGAQPTGTVYATTADLLGDIAMNSGGLSNFAVNGAGVLTTFGGGFFDEAGQFQYGIDGSITYTGNHSDTSMESEKVGFTAVQSGVVAFTTGFTKDANTAAFDYVNGTFAVLGELLGIYLNGTLLDTSLYFLSDDMLNANYAYASQYQFELDLNNVDELLVSGNNNISFMLLGIPLEYTGVDSHIYNDSMSFIHFSADVYQNTVSLLSGGGDGNDGEGGDSDGTTPEPATMLIFGIGLVGLGLRKKFTNKKTA